MVELALAVVALFLWLAIEPGLVRNIAYNVMLIGSISTLFHGGNRGSTPLGDAIFSLSFKGLPSVT